MSIQSVDDFDPSSSTAAFSSTVSQTKTQQQPTNDHGETEKLVTPPQPVVNGQNDTTNNKNSDNLGNGTTESVNGNNSTMDKMYNQLLKQFHQQQIILIQLKNLFQNQEHRIQLKIQVKRILFQHHQMSQRILLRQQLHRQLIYQHQPNPKQRYQHQQMLITKIYNLQYQLMLHLLKHQQHSHQMKIFLHQQQLPKQRF
jgi:hypothetical protein